MLVAAILLLLQEPSAAVSALVTEWQTDVVKAQEKAATQSWGSELAAELAIRTAGDQAAREGLMRLRKSATNERQKTEAGNIIIAQLERMDLDNTAFLEGNLPPEGWFRKSLHGSAVPSMAWLIVQHSRDRDFQKNVLERMEPLVKAKSAGKDMRYCSIGWRCSKGVRSDTAAKHVVKAASCDSTSWKMPRESTACGR